MSEIYSPQKKGLRRVRKDGVPLDIKPDLNFQNSFIVDNDDINNVTNIDIDITTLDIDNNLNTVDGENF